MSRQKPPNNIWLLSVFPKNYQIMVREHAKDRIDPYGNGEHAIDMN